MGRPQVLNIFVRLMPEIKQSGALSPPLSPHTLTGWVPALQGEALGKELLIWNGPEAEIQAGLTICRPALSLRAPHSASWNEGHSDRLQCAVHQAN